MSIHKLNKNIVKLITFAVITALLCQNIAWAKGDFKNQKSGARTEKDFYLKRDTFLKDKDFQQVYHALIIINLNDEIYGESQNIQR